MPSNGCNFGQKDILIHHSLSGEQSFFDGIANLLQVEVRKDRPNPEFTRCAGRTFNDDFAGTQDLHAKDGRGLVKVNQVHLPSQKGRQVLLHVKQPESVWRL
jgi:hypothetical protein